MGQAMTFTAWIMLLSAGVILARSVCLAAKLSANDWPGHPVRFAGIAAANALLAAGAVGVVLGWTPGTVLLLVGVAIKMMSDRRRSDG